VTTVDTFISEYTTTIQEQNERITAFNRAASHELRSPIGTLVFASALPRQRDRASDPRRLAKVVSTVKCRARAPRPLVENLQRIARISDLAGRAQRSSWSI
jgi:K+-sensing histidine kinase KdpD